MEGGISLLILWPSDVVYERPREVSACRMWICIPPQTVQLIWLTYPEYYLKRQRGRHGGEIVDTSLPFKKYNTHFNINIFESNLLFKKKSK